MTVLQLTNIKRNQSFLTSNRPFIFDVEMPLNGQVVSYIAVN